MHFRSALKFIGFLALMYPIWASAQLTKTLQSNSALALVKTECLPKRVGLEAMKAQVVKLSEVKFQKSTDCLLGYSEDALVLSANFESGPLEPRFKDQGFYSYSRYEPYYDTFQSPIFANLKPVVVAVIDSGISLSHQEFLGKLWVSGQGNFGYNFLANNFDVEDDAGHGSHVSGLIGANSKNRIGVSGSGFNLKLMTLKTQSADGRGSLGNVVNAIRFAVDNGAQVINLSLIIEGDHALLRDAISYALENNVVIVAAAGNQGIEITNQQLISPAGMANEYEGLISVTSVDSSNKALSFFSNYSEELIELAAPGSHDLEHILSTSKNGSYAVSAGTSMAAPQVSGVAAQLISSHISTRIPYTPATIENYILNYARQNPSLLGKVQNSRELDFKNLSQMIVQKNHLTSDGGFNDEVSD